MTTNTDPTVYCQPHEIPCDEDEINLYDSLCEGISLLLQGAKDAGYVVSGVAVTRLDSSSVALTAKGITIDEYVEQLEED